MEILHLGDDSRLVKTIPYPPREDQAQINGGLIKTRQLDDETRDSYFPSSHQLLERPAAHHIIISGTPIQNHLKDELEAELEVLESAELEEESLQPIEQDEKLEKGRKKGGSIALVAEPGKEKELKVEDVESAPNPRVCEGKEKGLVAEQEDHLSQDDLDDIDEHLAFQSRRFFKLKFKKNFGASKSNINRVYKSKVKCFKCSLACHFDSEYRKSDSGKKKFESVDYKQKYFELLKQKERAFITQENDWAAAGLEEDEDTSYVNLALMAKSDETEVSSSSNQVITTNLAYLSKDECNDAINDISTE
ncbi:hypothetical protein AgCh_012270 [Apium graveolens]